MNYSEARAYLAGIAARGSRLGLDSMRALMDELGNPQDQLSFIHIAGTNGKGSVMAYLEQTLVDAGYRVGRYISPVLFEYEEMIRVSGIRITREEVCAYTQIIRDAVSSLQRKGRPLPTIFEVETAMSFLHFHAKNCDLVLLETGMGGRDDATNIVTTTVLEIFSSISMDHMEFLGGTLAEIAACKAGIMKRGVPAVSDSQPLQAMEALRQEAAGQQADLRFAAPQLILDVHEGLKEQSFSYKSHSDIHISLAGTMQFRNASLALEAVDALRRGGFAIPEEAVRSGFQKASWPCRFQPVRENPWVILDGAHNPDAAEKLAESIRHYFPGRRIYYIFGVFSDKEYDRIIEITMPYAFRVFTVETRGNPRALPAGELAQAVRRVHPDATAVSNPARALEMALSQAAPEDVIILFGSLSWFRQLPASFRGLTE